jgi:hypothetical protein
VTPEPTREAGANETLCDRCGRSKPQDETDTCEACGAQICNDCASYHEGECCG